MGTITMKVPTGDYPLNLSKADMNAILEALEGLPVRVGIRDDELLLNATSKGEDLFSLSSRLKERLSKLSPEILGRFRRVSLGRQ